MPKYVEGPNGQVVEFPDDTSENVINVQMRRQFGGPAEGVGGILARNLVAAPGRMVEEAGRNLQTVGRVARSFVPSERGPSPAQTRVLADTMRIAPGLIPNPLLAGAGSAAGEAAAQGLERFAGERTDMDPTQIGVAGAIPPVAATGLRAARAVGRTITRAVPSAFRGAQQAAQQAGEELVQRVRPTVNVGQLQEGVEAAAADLIPMMQTRKLISRVRFPAEPANPAAEATRKSIGNLQAVMKPTGEIPLGELETIRRDIGPLVGRPGADRELVGLYGSIVNDLELAAAGGSPGAAMAREAAQAFRQEKGAGMLQDMIDKATTAQTTAGGESALNVARLKNAIKNNRTLLEKNLGPDAMKAVDAFTENFAGLPPATAYTAWNSMLSTVGGLGGAGVGAALGGPVGAGVGVGAALTGELVRNMAMAGRNPAVMNEMLYTLAQSGRIVGTQAMRAAGKTGLVEERRREGR